MQASNLVVATSEELERADRHGAELPLRWHYRYQAAELAWEAARLLPDNDDTLTNWGKHFGVTPRNPFALLSAVGEDLQGAIQMVPPEKLDALKKRDGVTLLSQELLASSFATLLRDPGAVQFTRDGGQFSLGGA